MEWVRICPLDLLSQTALFAVVFVGQGHVVRAFMTTPSGLSHYPKCAIIEELSERRRDVAETHVVGVFNEA